MKVERDEKAERKKLLLMFFFCFSLTCLFTFRKVISLVIWAFGIHIIIHTRKKRDVLEIKTRNQQTQLAGGAQ